MAGYENLFERYDTLVFFDTETTGLDPKKCQIIELAMLDAKKDGTKFEYDEFIRLPEGEHVPDKIRQITGITDEMLAGGIKEHDAALDIWNTISDGRTLMIAHNCQFDMCFVRETMRRALGKEKADAVLSQVDWLDSLTVYKDRASYPHKLANAIEHYDLTGSVVNSHRAIDDTKALAAVCNAMNGERSDLARYINVFGYNPKYGITGEKLPKITYTPQPYANGMTPEERILPAKTSF